MARLVEVIDLPLSPAAAFAWLADFANLPAWDPGALAARRLDGGPLGAGSRFAVEYAFLGRRVPLRYEIRVFEPGRRVRVEGGNASLRAVDEIGLLPREDGVRVVWEARLEPTGLAALLDPLLQLVFPWTARGALRGLRAHAAVLAREARDAA